MLLQENSSKMLSAWSIAARPANENGDKYPCARSIGAFAVGCDSDAVCNRTIR
jgi:hypothetical protein